jgi:hypothetical protein
VTSCSHTHTKIHDYSRYLSNVVIFLVEKFNSHKRHVLYDCMTRVKIWSQNVLVMGSTFWCNEMRNKRYITYYRMNFDVFQKLVLKLTPFLQFQCLNHVRPQLKIKKIVAKKIYRFIHGHSATHMVDHFNMGASTIHKTCGHSI